MVCAVCGERNCSFASDSVMNNQALTRALALDGCREKPEAVSQHDLGCCQRDGYHIQPPGALTLVGVSSAKRLW